MRLQIRQLFVLAALLMLHLHSVQAAPGDAVPAGPLLAPHIHYELAIYYTEAPSTPPMAALRRLLKSMVGAPTLTDTPSPEPQAPQLLAIWVTDALKSYAPPSLQSLEYFGRGLSSEQNRALQKANLALRLDFAHPSAGGLAAYRRSLQLTEDLARETHGLIWD